MEQECASALVPPPPGTSTTLATAMNLITVMVGAGVLAFPKAFSNAGWLGGPLVLLLSGLATLEAGLVTAESLALCEEQIRKGANYSFQRPERLEDLAEAAFGKRGRLIAFLNINIFMLCLCTAFIILIGSSLHFLTELSYFVWVLAVSVPFAGLSLLKEMDKLSKLSFIGVAASIVYVFAIAQAGVQAGWTNRSSPAFREHFNPDDPGKLGGVVAVMTTGFGYHVVVPSVRSAMAKPQDMPRAIRLATLVAVFVYAGVGALGYYGWGDIVSGNVLDSMVSGSGRRMVAGVVLSVAVVANLFVTYPILMNVVANATEKRLAVGYSPLLRLALLVVTVVVSLVCPLFMQVLSLIGSTVGLGSCTFLPLAVYWKLLLATSRRPPRLAYFKHSGVVILALLALIFGTGGAIADIVTALRPHAGATEVTQIVLPLTIG